MSILIDRARFVTRTRTALRDPRIARRHLRVRVVRSPRDGDAGRYAPRDARLGRSRGPRVRPLDILPRLQPWDSSGGDVGYAVPTEASFPSLVLRFVRFSLGLALSGECGVSEQLWSSHLRRTGCAIDPTVSPVCRSRKVSEGRSERARPDGLVPVRLRPRRGDADRRRRPRSHRSTREAVLRRRRVPAPRRGVGSASDRENPRRDGLDERVGAVTRRNRLTVFRSRRRAVSSTVLSVRCGKYVS